MTIYKITNLVNGKIYIGKTKYTKEKRLKEHFKCAEQGCNTFLYNAIRKYGKENFIIEELDIAKSISELNKKEKFWIDKLDSRNRLIGYNVAPGGDGGDTWTYANDLEKERRISIIKETNKSRITINNGKIVKRVKEYELDSYLDSGFVLGDGSLWDHGVGSRKLKGIPTKIISEDICVNLINDYKDGLPVYKCLEKYNIGYRVFKRVMGEHNIELIGNKGRKSCKNRITIYKDKEIKRVRDEELDYFLALGWKRGRGEISSEHRENLSKSLKNNPKMKKNKEQRTILSEKQSRHRVVNDGVKNIVVDVDDLDEWLSKPGISKGRIKKKN